MLLCGGKMDFKPLRKYSPKETLQRIMRWCDLQERSCFETEQKLKDWGVPEEESGHLVDHLLHHKYLNQERFARAFVSGKFRIKRWGKNKIVAQMKMKHRLSAPEIKEGLTEIEDQFYLETLDTLIRKKSNTTTAESEFQKNGKIVRHLINRGFEPNLVWQRMDHISD